MESRETMLKNIPSNLSPELFENMMKMGHGDKILLADANYPAHTFNKNVIRADGLNIPELLESILKFLPLDTYSDYQVQLMKVVEGEDVVPVIWEDYKEIIGRYEDQFKVEEIERFDFYEMSKSCSCIVLTSEKALYGNIMLTKGVL